MGCVLFDLGVGFLYMM